MVNMESLLGPLNPLSSPETRAIAISTPTGSCTLHGTSGPLGNPTDAALLMRLRQWSDAVFCGAATIRSEDYAGVELSPEASAQRHAEGRTTLPPIATLSASLDFDPASRFFTQTSTPPLIFTSPDHRGTSRARTLDRAGARLFFLTDLHPTRVIAELRRLGYPRIVCEGGPGVYGELLREQLIDVFHLTLAPFLTSRVERGLVDSGSAEAQRWHLEHTFAHQDSTLFLRYRRAAPTGPGPESVP
ncbi:MULTISPECIES: pyrimidine reductase family protein [unclassified Corynebacterium]|uniref:pyrimidine reductase family protein n=1 Tax=unclassified Corynebacterium TaxID=2624378 RepID=UPI0029CA8306|nr:MULTISPECIES: pyrimidine reductase family protein [unclassified Corynebacterium]WPF65215.1 pyrimidine reductase family protein [Corynebacterium sp. 22KM0430]WPF67710.1 pyrimidine reductase family protein [Corynebacterium sp. 21KM1197]